MAYKLVLPTAPDGLSHIWNVSAHVGDTVHCPNRADDVLLVQVLINYLIETGMNVPGVQPSCVRSIPEDGRMSPALAYWIILMNNTHRRALRFDQMGVISPARSASYGNDTWTIVTLNKGLKQRAANLWAGLPNALGISGTLRAALQRETP